MSDIYKRTLQIEFKYRQRCTKFVKHIKKLCPQYFDGKGERCVWMKFDRVETREVVKMKVVSEIKSCEIRKRENGDDYIFVN